LIPSLATPILAHLDRRLASDAERDNKELVRQREVIAAQVALAQTRERDFFGRLPAWIISTSVAVYVASVFVDSTWPSDWLNPLAVPDPFVSTLNIVIAALFGLGAVDKLFRK
jgi:hypothetical protein